MDSVDNNNWTPLHYSATHDDAAGVRLLLKHRADIDYQDSWGWTPLMVAAKHGNANTVAVFLAEGAAVGLLNEYGETFFDIAIDSRNDAVCKTVLESDRFEFFAFFMIYFIGCHNILSNERCSCFRCFGLKYFINQCKIIINFS